MKKLLILFILIPSLIYGASSVKNPTKCDNGTNWSSCGNTYASDNVRASNSTTAVDTLIDSAFVFSLPASSTIDSFYFIVEARGASTSAANRAAAVQCVSNGTLVGDKISYTLNEGTDQVDTIRGTTNDLFNTGWTVDSINNGEFGVAFIKDQSGLGGDEEVDHIQWAVFYTAAASDSTHTFYSGSIDENIHARYLSVTMFPTDSAFEFNGWQGESTVRISTDVTRTNTFTRVADTLWEWEQIIATNPNPTTFMWADSFAVTMDSVELLTQKASTSTRLAAYHQGEQGSSLQRNYTNAINDSIEYMNGKLFATGVRAGGTIYSLVIIDDDGDSLMSSFDTLHTRYLPDDGVIEFYMDSIILDSSTTTYPLQIIMRFLPAKAGFISYGQIGEGGGGEPFVFNGPTGSIVTGYGAWLGKSLDTISQPDDSICLYMGLFENCATALRPETDIENVRYEGELVAHTRGVPNAVFVPSATNPVLTNGDTYWIIQQRCRNAGGADSPLMYNDSRNESGQPPDTANFIAWFFSNENIGPPDSISPMSCNVLIEYKMGWGWIAYEEPRVKIVRAGATVKSGVSVE